MSPTGRVLPIVSISLLVACSSAPKHTYPGPERPRTELALLRESAEANVVGIDDERATGSAWLLLPGRHDVVLRVRLDTQVPNTSWTIWSYCGVALDASAGEDYTSRVRTRKEVTVGLGERVKIEVGIADAKGVLRATPYACSPKRPSFER